MTDIIWGNGVEVISTDTIRINVTHRKNENKGNYADSELIRIVEADLPGLPIETNQWTIDKIKYSVIDSFLKCEVRRKLVDGVIEAKVSHSGVGGY